MRSSSSLLFFFLLLLLNLASSAASSKLVLEDGYAVSTVLDGNKLSINPFSVLPRVRTQDLLLLDHVNSALYTTSFPISQDSKISLFSGSGFGFSDGDPLSAKFSRPRSFAIDLKGNVYVADKNNIEHRVIRKISGSGVTTIAGGYSTTPGHTDGPAQNASFSEDFDLVFIPKICALLISDRGNRLVRQMNLKPEDCASDSRVESGVASVSVIGGLCLLVGLIAGFAVRPYLVSHGGIISSLSLDMIWKHCRMNLQRRVPTPFFDIRSAVVRSTPCMLVGRIIRLNLSSLSLMFRVHRAEKRSFMKEHVSLLDMDAPTYHCSAKSQVPTNQWKDLMSLGDCSAKSQVPIDQWKDLMSLGEGLNVLEVNTSVSKEDKKCDASTYSQSKVDDMIQATISAFDSQAKQDGPWEGFVLDGSDLAKEKGG